MISSKIQPTDGHPHSYTKPAEFCVTLIMQGYRKVKGCENSKITRYPRQLLPTPSKLVVVEYIESLNI